MRVEHFGVMHFNCFSLLIRGCVSSVTEDDMVAAADGVMLGLWYSIAN